MPTGSKFRSEIPTGLECFTSLRYDASRPRDDRVGAATQLTARCDVIRFVNFYVGAADWTDLVLLKPRDDAF